MLKNRKGFTLIELLIVVVIIGILAAIALPKFSAARERAYFSAMKSDLKALSSAQEIYYSKNLAYAALLADLDFNASEGVTVAEPTTYDDGGVAQGWSSTSTHSSLAAAVGCAIFNGNIGAAAVTAPGGEAATAPGVPVCDEQ